MKVVVKVAYILFSAVLLIYLALPNPTFPEPPPDSLQSDEPADTETPLRRAYFTNLSRAEVLAHYESRFKLSIAEFTIPIYRLNYPPEEAQTIIRDQERSTYLEEIVHPFRESLFVNGFEPKEAKDKIVIQNRTWKQKIVIRYVPSSIFVRVTLATFTILLVVILYKQWVVSIKTLFSKN